MPPVEQKNVIKNSTNISNQEKSQKTHKSKKSTKQGVEKPKSARFERSQAVRTRPEQSRADRAKPERSQAVRTNPERSLAPRTQPEKSQAVRSQAIRTKQSARANECEKSAAVTQKTIKVKREPEERSGFLQFGRNFKQFISRPLNDESLKSLVSKVKNRSTTITRKTVDFGEDVFVTMRNRRQSSEVVPSPVPVVLEEVDADGSDIMSSTSELAKVTSNPDNNQQIFIGRRPFWFVPSDAPTDEELKGIFESPEITAQSLIEVSEGKKTIKTVSALPIGMDPFVDLDILKGRDSVFFSNDVIFSNTVRSIINTNNLMQSIKETKKRKDTNKKVKIIDPPTIVLFYKRKTRRKTREDKFVHMLDPKKKK